MILWHPLTNRRSTGEELGLMALREVARSDPAGTGGESPIDSRPVRKPCSKPGPQRPGFLHHRVWVADFSAKDVL